MTLVVFSLKPSLLLVWIVRLDDFSLQPLKVSANFARSVDLEMKVALQFAMIVRLSLIRIKLDRKIVHFVLAVNRILRLAHQFVSIVQLEDSKILLEPAIVMIAAKDFIRLSLVSQFVCRAMSVNFSQRENLRVAIFAIRELSRIKLDYLHAFHAQLELINLNKEKPIVRIVQQDHQFQLPALPRAFSALLVFISLKIARSRVFSARPVLPLHYQIPSLAQFVNRENFPLSRARSLARHVKLVDLILIIMQLFAFPAVLVDLIQLKDRRIVRFVRLDLLRTLLD